MSEVKIMNRTPETFGQKLERERLEAETNKVEREEQIETLIAQVASNSSAATTAKTIWDTPEGQAAIDRAVDTAAGELMAATEPTLTPELETAVKQILSDRHAPRDPDLRDFRDQVIGAFKHLGLDTRKFFGV